MKFVAIAAGGAVGALLRYAVSGLAYNLLGEGFPWGTLSVNLIGSFLIGFLWLLFERAISAPDLRTFVFIGGLGAFTTFSTFALESVNLLQDGEIRLGLLNLAAANLLGLAAVVGGFFAARFVLGIRG